MDKMTTRITPAPGRLELVRQFANTLDVEEQTDALDDQRSAQEWLISHGLSATELGGTGIAYLKRVRVALRDAMATSHRDASLDPETLATLNEAVADAKISPELAVSGPRWVSHATGVEAAVGALAVEMIEAMKNGTWSRLKICSNDRCQWAFYDRSPARSGKWCSMSVCGNRTKQQAWRERRS